MKNFNVELLDFDDLTDDEKGSASDNGYGKECANYIKVTHKGNVIFLESDAIEPEDKSFRRDLNWIIDALKSCYELGKNESNMLSRDRYCDVSFAVKWTLENAKYLEPDDNYLIEKEVDKCFDAITKEQRLNP